MLMHSPASLLSLQYAIMFLSALSSALHYILHTIDRQSEDPWENKTIYIRIVDIITGSLSYTCVCVLRL